MQALRKRRTLSSVAFRSSLRSFRRSPIAAEVRAIKARWAKPISPIPIAAPLWLKCSSCSPTQTRSPAAPPPMWQLALIQEIGLSKPCSSYSSVLAKSLAIREKSSSRRSMLLRRLISLAARDSPDTSPPHPTLMTRVYEHLFVGSRGYLVNFAGPAHQAPIQPPAPAATPPSLFSGSSASVPNLEPPSQLITGPERWRWYGQVRTVSPAGRGLDRDLPIPAQIPVAHPNPHIRCDVPVPHEFDRSPRTPCQARTIGRTSSQEHLATHALLRPRHGAPHLDLHVLLIAKQRMGTPVGKQRSIAGVRIHVLEPDGGIAQGDPPTELPRQHSAGAFHRRVVDHRPRQPPRLTVIRQPNTRKRACARILRRIDIGHHLVPARRTCGDKSLGGPIIDADALVEQLVACEPQGRNPRAALRANLHLPRPA